MRYGKFVSAVYIINIVIQSFFSLACPMGLGFLIAWLLVSRLEAPTFLYPIFIVLGALVGLYSMVRFILDAMTAVERLERANMKKIKEKKKAQKDQEESQK